MSVPFKQKLAAYLGRGTDHGKLKRSMVQLAREYIMACERYDRSISKLRDERGWAMLTKPVQQGLSTTFAEERLKGLWGDVANEGHDPQLFKAALSAEAELVGNMTWEAYCTMDRPDLKKP